MKIVVFNLLIFVCNIAAYATDGFYPVSAIPAHLIEGANVVVRTEHTEFKVLSLNEATWKIKVVKTILNSKGKYEAAFVLPYDVKLNKIISIKGNIYNEHGKLITKVKNSEIQDISGVSGGSLFESTRLKVFEPKNHIYPYTVEYEVEYQNRNLLFYPTWNPQETNETAVEEATLEITLPKSTTLRYKQINLNDEPQIVKDDKSQKYKWQIKDVGVLKPEDYGPKNSELKKIIYTAPAEFEFEGYRGDMSSWSSIGNWQKNVIEGRDKLSESTVLKLKELVKNEKDDLGRIKKVYEYLQANTRYVSIQLGIGGWQPFEASVVEKYGYGDCKALSNYTMAMLKSLGIKSYYTLVKAGADANPILHDFPSRQFNHVILCVPMQKDTVWLECTSQQNPFGFLGDFTSDRHALLVTDEGGKLVKTPTYSQEQNLQHRKVSVNLLKDGNGLVHINTEYSGLKFSNVDHQLTGTSEDKEKWLYKSIEIGSFEIKKFKYQLIPSSLPKVQEEIELIVRNCTSVSGKRMFLTPNLMNKMSFNLSGKPEDRKTDIVYNYSFHDIDTIVYHLPEGYYPESFPESQNLKSQFGEYRTTFINEENKITYIREIKMNKGRYPASLYEDFANFKKDITKADKVKIVLINKT